MSARLQDVLGKAWTLVGVPLVVVGMAALAKGEGEWEGEGGGEGGGKEEGGEEWYVINCVFVMLYCLFVDFGFLHFISFHFVVLGFSFCRFCRFISWFWSFRALIISCFDHLIFFSPFLFYSFSFIRSSANKKRPRGTAPLSIIRTVEID